MKLLAAVLFVAATAAPAAAQTGARGGSDPGLDPAASAAAQDCARFRKKGQPCVLTFGEGDTIEAGVQSPLGDVINPRDVVTFTSLIRIRFDFRAEIIRAAEDI